MKFITHCSGIELRRMLAALAIVSIALGCNTFDVEARVSSVVSQASDTNNAGFAHAGQTALMQSPAPTTEPVGTEDNAETGDDTFPETTAEMAHGTFTGQVRNHSTDQPVGSDVRVLLYVIDDRFQEEVLTTVTDENGRYRFDNVPVQTGWHYLVSAQYGDGYFTGGMVAGTPNNPDVDLPVPVYDVTDDPSVISIGSVLTQVVPIESGLRMVQVFQFVNDSGQLFVTNETIDDAHNASVVVPLPAGAQVQSFNDQQRYVLSADGQSVISVDPVFPDETHIVHVMYTLPYSDSTRVEQTINYRLNGSVEVIAPDVLSIESTQLTTGSAEVIDGNRFLTYAGDLTLARGETLYYEVQGNLVSGGIESGAFMDNTALTVALSSLAILLVIAGVWVYWRRQQPPVESTAGAHDQSTIDSLVSQIADLDRLHQAGQLETEAYRAERERLKARLSRLMKEQYQVLVIEEVMMGMVDQVFTSDEASQEIGELPRPRLLQIWQVLAAVGVLFGLYMALSYAGTDANQGHVQRIFYIHLGAFAGAAVAFTGTAIGGAMYLRSRHPKWDVLALSGVEVGFVLSSVTLLTGMFWARPIWNTWWTWDPRLTSAAIMTLTYAAYLMFRNGIHNPDQRRRFASIYGILALSTVIFTFIITRIRPDTIHPTVIGPSVQNASGSFEMTDSMLAAMISNMIVWSVFLAPTLIWWRIRLENTLERINIVRQQLTSE